jgi:hypothetical protein
MGVVEDARDALRRGENLAWTLPLVAALGPDGRTRSVAWVERCLRRLLPSVPTTNLDSREAVLEAVDDLRRYEGRSPPQEEVWERSYAISFPRCEARVAVRHLHRAWWYSRFAKDNQFIPEQEAALRLMLEATGRPDDLTDVILQEFERCNRAWQTPRP